MQNVLLSNNIIKLSSCSTNFYVVWLQIFAVCWMCTKHFKLLLRIPDRMTTMYVNYIFTILTPRNNQLILERTSPIISSGKSCRVVAHLGTVSYRAITRAHRRNFLEIPICVSESRRILLEIESEQKWRIVPSAS